MVVIKGIDFNNISRSHPVCDVSDILLNYFVVRQVDLFFAESYKTFS